MIEINKKIYMNEKTFKIKEEAFLKLQTHFKNINKKIK